MQIDDANQLVWNNLSFTEGASISDILEGWGGPIRIGTVRSALKRLLATGEVTRKWDGNARFGRYLYKAKNEV